MSIGDADGHLFRLSAQKPQTKEPETTAFSCCFWLFFIQRVVHSVSLRICVSGHIDNISDYGTLELRKGKYEIQTFQLCGFFRWQKLSSLCYHISLRLKEEKSMKKQEIARENIFSSIGRVTVVVYGSTDCPIKRKRSVGNGGMCITVGQFVVGWCRSRACFRALSPGRSGHLHP